MDVARRRGLIETANNPEPRLDYVVALEGHMATGDGTVPNAITLCYVPDRLIIDPASFGRYLKALSEVEWRSLEDLAVTILTDVNNEAVARWVHVTASTHEAGQSGLDRHTVTLEDRQPSWDNAPLLSRLKKY